MGERIFYRSFENFKGINYLATPISDNQFNAIAATNFIFGKAKSLKPRPGSQLLGQAGDFVGGHVYSYANTVTGAVAQKLLAMNHSLWELATSSITITRTAGSGNIGYELYYSTSDAQFIFRLLDNGAYVTGGDFGVSGKINLGSGLEINKGKGAGGVYTVGDLVAAIDATTNFSCALPTRSARINGAQAGVTTGITVDAGHTFSVRDILYVWNHNASAGGLINKRVTATGATAVTFTAMAAYTLDVLDDQWIGIASTPAASIPYTTGTSTSASTLPISFYYWDWVWFDTKLASENYYPFDSHYGRLALLSPDESRRRSNSVNTSNALYFTAPAPIGAAFGQSESNATLWKYDGNRVFRAGLPTPLLTSATPAAGSDTYIWKVTNRMFDQAGNIVDSEASNEIEDTSAALPSTLVYQTYENNDQSTSNPYGLNTAGCLVNGSQSGAGTQTGLTVDNNTLKAGDVVYIYNNTTLGIITRTLTAASATTLTWASTTAIDVTDNAPISNGMIQRIWRTKAGGTVFYLVIEYPNNCTATTQSLSENVTDANLGAQFDEPEINREPGLPPKCWYVTSHQGLLVTAGDPANPNTVNKSLAEEPEQFAEASSGFDVPSSITGPVTAIYSDTDDRLAVFKNNAYYDVVGDLDTGSVSIRPVKEGDYGIAAQTSISRVNGKILGVGPLGVLTVLNGEAALNYGVNINPSIFQNTSLYTNLAVACNDFSIRHYQIVVPTTNGWADAASNNSDLFFSLDYENEWSWFDKDYPNLTGPSAWLGVYNGALHHLNAYHNVLFSRGFFFRSFTGETPNDYRDHNTDITCTFRTKWDSLGEASTYKIPVRHKLYSFPDYGKSISLCTWTARVRYDLDTAGDSGQNSVSLAFTGTNQEAWQKIGPRRFRYVELQLTVLPATPTYLTPYLTGYEFVFSADYQKTDILR